MADAIDNNFLGRGMALGLRAIYSGAEDRSLRLYHAVPRVLGEKGNLEIFLEGKNEVTEGLRIDRVEGWAQISSTLGPRTGNRLYLRYQDLFFRAAEDPSAASSRRGDRRDCEVARRTSRTSASGVVPVRPSSARIRSYRTLVARARQLGPSDTRLTSRTARAKRGSSRRKVSQSPIAASTFLRR